MVERRVLLVVDADAQRRAELNRLLAATPHALVHAADVDDGLARFSEAKPDLILLAAPVCGALGGSMLEQIAVRADEMAAPVFALHTGDPPGGELPPGLSAVLPLPITRASLEKALTEVAARRAAVFAQSAMELDLDALPPMDGVGDEEAPPDTVVPPAAEAAPAEPAPPPAEEPAAEPEAAAEEPATATEVAAVSDEEEPVPAGPPVMDEPTMLSGPEELAAAAEAVTPPARNHRSDTAEMEAVATDPPSGEATEALEANGESDEPIEGERTPPEGTPAAVVQAVIDGEAPSTDPPSEPTAEVSSDTVEASVDTVEAATADGPEPAARTNVGEQPEGLDELQQAGPPVHNEPSSDDVFASSAPAPEPPRAEPPVETAPAPSLEPLALDPPAPRSDEKRPPIGVGERRPPAPGTALPRVVKLEAAPLPRDVELSTSERAATGKGGFRVLDEGILGPDLTARLLTLYRLLDGGTLYQALGVEESADGEALRAAFHRMSLDFHPDRGVLLVAGPLKDCLRAVYARATEAFRVLSSPDERAAYDAALKALRSAPPPVEPPTSTSQETVLPSVIVDDDAPASVRPALQATPAARLVVPPPSGRSVSRSNVPVRSGEPNAPTTPPPVAVAAPAATEVLAEDSATTVGGKKFLRLAVQALGRNDLNGARLNLTFALGYEPDNAVLKKRLQEIEGKMSRPAAR